MINTSLPIMQQNLALKQNQQANAANSANAFGGSRQAVQQGVTQAQGALGMGQMAAEPQPGELHSGAGCARPATSTGAMWRRRIRPATDRLARNLAAQTTNQGAAQAKIIGLLASQGLTASGTAQNQANAANFAMLTSAGAQQQQQAQNQINAQIAKFAQAWGYPQRSSRRWRARSA